VYSQKVDNTIVISKYKNSSSQNNNNNYYC